jgi:hypothetical protein
VFAGVDGACRQTSASNQACPLRITQWNLYIRCCLPFRRERVVDLSLTRQVISRRASVFVQFASSASPPLWVLTPPTLRSQFTLSVLFAFQVPYKEYCSPQNYKYPFPSISSSLHVYHLAFSTAMSAENEEQFMDESTGGPGAPTPVSALEVS